MIEIKNVFKKFKNVTALNGLTLTIRDNECFSLLGLNGAGKTTLINVLSTVIKKDGGEVYVNGVNLDKDPEKVRKIINVSPQENAVCKKLTVKENLELVADLYGIENKSEKVAAAIKKFGLLEKAGVQARKLSGGQQRRLSIALAIISEPQILFLDEPTLGLDVKARAVLWSVIEELKKEMTVVLTTHYLDEVEHLSDRVGIMTKGKIKAVGTVKEITEQTGKNSLEEAFLSLTEEDV